MSGLLEFSLVNARATNQSIMKPSTFIPAESAADYQHHVQISSTQPALAVPAAAPARTTAFSTITSTLRDNSVPAHTHQESIYIPAMPRSRFLNPYYQGACKQPTQSYQSMSKKEDLRSLPEWQRFTIVRPRTTVEHELKMALRMRKRHERAVLRIRKGIRRQERSLTEECRKRREQTKIVRDCKRRLLVESSSEDEASENEGDADGEWSGF